MKGKLEKAIANNNSLYKIIFEQYRIKSAHNGFIWYCFEETPPLYSNIVTASQSWRPDDIFQRINDNYESENWFEWSLKDSFSVLSLNDFGFAKLFDAQWMYLEAENFTPLTESRQLRYEIIENKSDLAKWKRAWDPDVSLGNKIFTQKLLHRKDAFFVAGFSQKAIVSGCFINETEDFHGISNFFSTDKSVVYWSDLIKFVHEQVGKKDITGYERNDLVNQLCSIGFEAIGDLTVWLKKNVS